MTLCELYLCAQGLFGRAPVGRGLVMVARLGRYGHHEEREAALLLDVFRNGALGQREQAILSLAPETLDILFALTGAREVQRKKVCRTGDISAARVLLCDCYSVDAQEDEADARRIAQRLLRWLPPESTETLKRGHLGAQDVTSLFSPQHAEVNYL